MKRKILSFLFIGVLILGLTGCGGNNNKNIEKSDNKKGQNAQKEKIEVNSVLATSENYAVVIAKDGTTYVIDKDGNVQGNIPNIASQAYQINDNGYVFQIGESYKKVYDKTGKEIIN